MKWVLKPSNSDTYAVLKDAYPMIHPTLLSYLSTLNLRHPTKLLDRSITTLTDPLELPDANKAVALITEAILQQHRIVVFGDYDGDGITSTATAWSALNLFGAMVTPFLPNRLQHGYGFKRKAIHEMMTLLNPQLIITVDCGINSKEEVEYVKSTYGIPVIITDHHEPETTTCALNADALVNPKLGDNVEQREMAGVGVIWNLMLAVCNHLESLGKGPYLDKVVSLLEYVAIGTITDVMQLQGDNRTMVSHGLKKLSKSEKPGIVALKRLLNLTEVSSGDIGFKIGPRINAAGRMGDPKIALDLLLSSFDLRATELAHTLDDMNTERKEVEQKVTEEIITELSATFNPEEHYGLIGIGYEYHPGIVGITAAKVAEKFNRPTIIVSLDENGVATGSCRSIHCFDILEGLRYCSDLLISYGGHKFAAGVKFRIENLDLFREKFNTYAKHKLQGQDITPILEIAGILPSDQVSKEFYEQQKLIGPYGNTFPEPIWQVDNLHVKAAMLIKGLHLKLILETVSGNTLEAIQFNYTGKLPTNKIISAVGLLGINTYRDKQSLQLLLKDFKEMV